MEGTVTEGYRHVIITRYFTRFPSDRVERNSWIQAHLDWLNDRFILFTSYCLPSVTAQTEQNFLWLIYIDAAVPAAYLERLQAAINPYANIKLKLCDFFSSENIVDDLQRELGATEWLLTTRLDNDDGLSADFVSRLQASVHLGTREFLDFPNGILYYQSKTYLYHHESNAFISLFEPMKGASTVWCGAHEHLGSVATIRQIDPWPAFVQVVHGKNVSNKPRGVRVHKIFGLRGFEAIPAFVGVSLDENNAQVLFDGVVSGILWRLRDMVFGFLKTLRSLLTGKH
jgi:hypothetical protein